MNSKNIIPLPVTCEKNVKYSRMFGNEYLNISNDPELLDQPILVLDIIFQLMQDLKKNMFHVDRSEVIIPERKANQLALDLWENEILATDKSILKLFYKSSQFLKNRNNNLMANALKFLKTYKYGLYSFKNSEGVELTTSGGLIQDWYLNRENGVFEISLSLYWADKIVRLNAGNWVNLKPYVVKTFKTNKQRYFVLWLMRLKKYAGTVKNYKDMLRIYDLNYKYKSQFMRDFLMPIKERLDSKELNHNWFSFIYLEDKNNPDNIRFITYDVKPNDDIALNGTERRLIEKSVREANKKAISYRVKYLRRRHCLSADQANYIKTNLIGDTLVRFEQAYKDVLKHFKKENLNAPDIPYNQLIAALEDRCTVSA